MSAYDTWNARLVDHFFSPNHAGRAVRLAVTQDLLDELGEGYDDFIFACQRGSDAWRVSRVENVAEYAVKLMACWREPECWPSNIPRDIPPYAGYLGLFVLVASEGKGFHGRLADLFPCSGWNGGFYPHFQEVRPLWDDLALWSTESSSRNDRVHRGVFSPLQLGAYNNIGILRAQTILTRAECGHLPALFEEADLTPDSEASDKQLLDVVRTYGSGALSGLTLGAAEDEDLSGFLCEELRHELRAWDGVVSAGENEGSATSRITSAPAELRLYQSRGRWSARVCVAWPGDQGTDSIFEPVSGGPVGPVGVRWGVDGAEPIRGTDGLPLDATRLDWGAGAAWRLMSGPPGPSRVRLRGSEVRVFVPDRGFWSEIATPRAGVECVIATSPKYAEEMRNCLQTGLVRTEVGGPVPDGWTLFTVARTPESVSHPSVSREPFLRLVGGVTLDGKPGRYHTFAPPRVVVGGDATGVTVTVNGAPLAPADVYELPLDVYPGSIEVEVRRDKRVLDARTFVLADSYHAGDPKRVCGCADRFGFSTDGPDGWCGAWVNDDGQVSWPPPVPATRSSAVRTAATRSRPRRQGSRWVLIPSRDGLRPGNANSQLLHESWVPYVVGEDGQLLHASRALHVVGGT